MDQTLLALIVLIGDVAIISAFAVLSGRVGGFTLLSGERRWELRNLALGLAIAVVVPLAIRFVASASWDLSIWVATGAYVLLLPRLRAGFLREHSDPAAAAEIARREAFGRSRVGVALYVGLLLTVLVWSWSLINAAPGLLP